MHLAFAIEQAELHETRVIAACRESFLRASERQPAQAHECLWRSHHAAIHDDIGYIAEARDQPNVEIRVVVKRLSGSQSVIRCVRVFRKLARIAA